MLELFNSYVFNSVVWLVCPRIVHKDIKFAKMQLCLFYNTAAKIGVTRVALEQNTFTIIDFYQVRRLSCIFVAFTKYDGNVRPLSGIMNGDGPSYSTAPTCNDRHLILELKASTIV